ncbi:hypothetical protein MRB53_037912 [Persea americana]|nr:hypothetical protein MRB53_037912 [Persea americana]
MLDNVSNSTTAQVDKTTNGTSSMPRPISPPMSRSPPVDEEQDQEWRTAVGSRSGSEAVDPDELSRALEDVEHGGRQREHTPGLSPTRKRRKMQYGDSLLHDEGSPATPLKTKKRPPHGELHYQKSRSATTCPADGTTDNAAAEEANRTYSNLLRAEMFSNTIPSNVTPVIDHDLPPNRTRARTPPSTTSSLPRPHQTPSTPHKNLFSYSAPRHYGPLSPQRTPSSRHSINLDARSEIYSLSPVKLSSQQMLLSPRKAPRAVSKVPYKVLDAPELADDFYLNLVDWGQQQHARRRPRPLRLHVELDVRQGGEAGSHIAIGTYRGLVQIWDAERQRRLRTMTGHAARVGALAWNEHILTSGSRDRSILHRDVRSPDPHFARLVGHKQEVCGLKWNQADGQLASGGNDNKLLVWDGVGTEPLWKFTEHTAAVKAIAWSPHQRNLLASGGGTADRRIRFWNTSTGTLINELDTGSQVCNLAWSRNSNELVSTHGYSQNQIVVWKYPSMTQVVSLTGHTFRVLYLAMSPDGQVIVTGAGDETLRFWNCFKRKEREGRGLGKLEEWGMIR